MRTIGAKVSDDLYEECSSVQRLLGILSRSDYVRLALRLLNGSVFRAVEEMRLTVSIEPVQRSSEPLDASRTVDRESSHSDIIVKGAES